MVTTEGVSSDVWNESQILNGILERSSGFYKSINVLARIINNLQELAGKNNSLVFSNKKQEAV